MKKLIFCLLLSVTFINTHAQCSLTLQASVDSVLCGECFTLSAYGSMDGNVVFEEDFNSGAPTGWQSTQTVTIANNTCGQPSPDGTDFMWMGDASANPRDMTTNGYDLTQGGVICFDMRFSVQGDAAPCEGPDEPDEGVFIRYSIDNGATWVDIQYWDPNGGNDPQLTNWNNYCVTIPPAAQTTNTMIQWHQNDVTGPEYDHWGLDNVQITLNDPNSQITWLHDNYNYPLGSGGGDHPTPECITANQTYTAQITNGTNTCTESITVPVRLPNLVVSAGGDTSICAGDCIDLNGEAKVVTSPAKTPTYENAEIGSFVGAPFSSFSADMNLNITDLNTTSLTAGSITSVCITNVNMSTDLADADFVLMCPGGSSINLISMGDISGNSIVNMCFEVGGTPLSSGAEPYTGTFAPSEPFSNLVGCDPNGVWNLAITGSNGFSITIGQLSGWDISFDDPELSYQANFTWSPTTGLSDPNILNPNICPTGDVSYTISASDQYNCVTETNTANITVLPVCCNFGLSAVVTNPSCGASDGGIDLSVVNGTGPYSFDWGANGTTEDLTGLPAGTYQVTVYDSGQMCSKDTTISISSNAFTFTTTTTDPTCGNTDGSIEFNVTGGTPTLEYSVDNGATYVTADSIGALAAGTYNLSVRDGAGCIETGTATLAQSCCNFTVSAVLTAPTCGASDGAIDITVAGGSGNFGYDWGANGTTEDLTALPSGSYTVSVYDSVGMCSKDTTFTLGASGFSFTVNKTQPTCGNANGQIEFVVTGGTPAFNYSIDGGTTTSTNPVFTGLNAGTYNLWVEDGTACQITQQDSLLQSAGINVSAVTVDLICNGDNSGRITLSANGGVAPYTYDIGGGPQSTAVFNNIAAGTYNVSVTDNTGCTFDSVVIIQEPVRMYATLSVVDPTCYNTCDGSATATVFGGSIATTPNYTWTGSLSGNTTGVATGACAGNYSLTVTDDNGCAFDTNFVINGPLPVVSDFSSTPPSTTILNPEIVHIEQSSNATNFTWFVEGVEEGTGTVFVYEYPDLQAGTYTTCLLAENTLGCSDSTCHDVIIENDLIFFVPNTFTPDDDNKNEVFTISGSGLTDITYSFEVFNRWGELIWSKVEDGDAWDGTHKNVLCPEGVYIWVMKITDQGPENKTTIGSVNLVR